MSLENKKILIVEDDPINIDILASSLHKEKCISVIAKNGEKGLAILESQHDISAVLLDWIMPVMNGLDMLKEMKKKSETANIPIIMQTSRTDTESVIAGINAGAYYYLTKPYDQNVLLAVLKRAIAEYDNYKTILTHIRKERREIASYFQNGEIRFRTIEEGLRIASWFSEFTRNDKISHSLAELLINAVEHGNLEIDYNQKTELLMDDMLEFEISRRLEESRYREKYVIVSFKKNNNTLNITIEDMGQGFDYYQYLEIDPKRVFDLHGRGIAIANMNFLNGILFNEKGNKVEVQIIL